MSTAKSMAAQYLNGKRNQYQPAKFKSSTSNLASSTTSNSRLAVGSSSKTANASKSRLKSTSMTNLVVDGNNEAAARAASGSPTSPAPRLQRPASRSALDSIHNGMNAKYAQVQSKVLLQNIRPQATGSSSKIPTNNKDSTLTRRSVTPQRATLAGSTKVPNDRTVLMNKLKQQQEELEKGEEEREQLRQELEREKSDKTEQIQQLKQELQEKMAENDKHNEEYHQKLLEAYELADQNRRAADTVLSESRQRDEEARKKIEELEQQLGELKEFIAMKEEMTNKMYELREQIRLERERYEEQLKSLHQVFENEKISRHKYNKRDKSSNYFNRVKPSLQSTESIDQIGGLDGIQASFSPSSSDRQKHHRSEHDIYGSKLSTRMHESARSAWKASKHFASSVITGGVGLSACRKSSKQQRGLAHQQSLTTPQIPVTVISTQPQCQFYGADDQHTSVVEVNHSESQVGAASPSPQNLHELERNGEQQATAAATSLIRVDENNKLTIVTKFSTDPNSECQGPSSSEQQASCPSTGSERSRCESSSSGRGTSSDAGSAASQNGEDEQSERQAGKAAARDGSTSAKTTSGGPKEDPQQQQQQHVPERRHKRKSSLFKASKVFGGSQVSLNKLKGFFNGNSAALNSTSSGVASEQLESSRIRCMELNQAIKVPSTTICNNNNNHLSSISSKNFQVHSAEEIIEREARSPSIENDADKSVAQGRQVDPQQDSESNNNNIDQVSAKQKAAASVDAVVAELASAKQIALQVTQ